MLHKGVATGSDQDFHDHLTCRALLLTGDYFLGGVVAGALTKLLLRLRKLNEVDALEVNKLTAEAMLYIVSILRLGESQASQHPRDDDAVDRMVTCLKVRSRTDAALCMQFGCPVCHDIVVHAGELRLLRHLHGVFVL